MSTCCGGNCGCGSRCMCGNACGGCKMYPDFSFGESTTAETLIIGVAPQKGHFGEGSEMGAATEHGCKCGSNCTCDPCTCK